MSMSMSMSMPTPALCRGRPPKTLTATSPGGRLNDRHIPGGQQPPCPGSRWSDRGTRTGNPENNKGSIIVSYHLTVGIEGAVGARAGLFRHGCRGAIGGRFRIGRCRGGCWPAAPARRPVSTREATARGRLLGGGAAPGPVDASDSDRGRFTGAICG